MVVVQLELQWWFNQSFRVEREQRKERKEVCEETEGEVNNDSVGWFRVRRLEELERLESYEEKETGER